MPLLRGTYGQDVMPSKVKELKCARNSASYSIQPNERGELPIRGLARANNTLTKNKRGAWENKAILNEMRAIDNRQSSACRV